MYKAIPVCTFSFYQLPSVLHASLLLSDYLIASKFRLQDVDKLLMKHLQEAVIDWRLAYKELPSIIVNHVTERERTKLKS
jgi:hypothetical protein